jgi:hypothetical protein
VNLVLKKPAQIIELAAGFVNPYSFKVFNMVSLTSNSYGSSYGNISRNGEEFDFNFILDGQLVSTIRFSRMYLSSGITEKIFLEQTFSYIKTLLKKEIKNRRKEIKRLETCHSKIRENFKDYILLEKIEGDKND